MLIECNFLNIGNQSVTEAQAFFLATLSDGLARNVRVRNKFMTCSPIEWWSTSLGGIFCDCWNRQKVDLITVPPSISSSLA